MDDLFANPYWRGLNTEQAGIAVGGSLARRYPANVLPFGGLAGDTPEAMSALRELLTPGERLWITGDRIARVSGLTGITELPGVQMIYPPALEPPAGPAQARVCELTCADAPAMVALTDAAFPGFFRARTCILGRYFGIRVDGVLIAMAGERIALPGYREISAVCTHPSHTGQGYAAQLLRHLMRDQRERGLQSFLHASASNRRAIAIYERLGFVKSRDILFHQLERQ